MKNFSDCQFPSNIIEFFSKAFSIFLTKLVLYHRTNSLKYHEKKLLKIFLHFSTIKSKYLFE